MRRCIAVDLRRGSAAEVKNPRVNHLMLDFGKLQPHLIQPGRIGRRKVEPYKGLLGKELLDRRRFVRRRIVQQEMNLSRHFAFLSNPVRNPRCFSLSDSGPHVQRRAQ